MCVWRQREESEEGWSNCSQGESGGKSLVRKLDNSTLTLPLQVPQINVAINVLG